MEGILLAEDKELEKSGDIIEISQDGRYSEIKWSDKMKSKFILLLNWGSIKNKNLEKSVLNNEDIEEDREAEKINKIDRTLKIKRRYNIDLSKQIIRVDSQGRRYIDETDVSKLKILDKKDGKIVKDISTLETEDVVSEVKDG